MTRINTGKIEVKIWQKVHDMQVYKADGTSMDGFVYSIYHDDNIVTRFPLFDVVRIREDWSERNSNE